MVPRLPSGRLSALRTEGLKREFSGVPHGGLTAKARCFSALQTYIYVLDAVDGSSTGT
jgi:hypothetical protein